MLARKLPDRRDRWDGVLARKEAAMWLNSQQCMHASMSAERHM